MIETTVTSGEIKRLAIAAEPVPVVEPITLQQAKDHLRVVFGDEDAYIEMLIAAARQMAEGKLNRTIAQRQLEVTFTGWGNDFHIPKPPLVSIDEIVYSDADGIEQVLSPDAYRFSAYPEPGRFELVGGAPLPALYRVSRPVTVRYTAGYTPEDVPQPIITWMLLAIGAMYGNRESVTAGTQTYTLPPEYMSWFLQPYMVYE